VGPCVLGAAPQACKEGWEVAEKRNKRRPVAAATTTVAVVEFYDAYALEGCGGSSLGRGRQILE